MTVGKVPKVDFKEALVKVPEARLACGYDPSTPGIGEDREDLDGLASHPWYDEEYPDGGGDGGEVDVGPGGEGGDGTE